MLFLLGFGKFEICERAARKSCNPQTGKMMTIAARKAPAFKAGKVLKASKSKWNDVINFPFCLDLN